MANERYLTESADVAQSDGFSVSNTGYLCQCDYELIMTGGLEPTESTDDEITVIILGKPNRRERIACSSFKEAIQLVKAKNGPETTVKIENRDDEILFTSVEMDIEDWENEWQRAKRQLAVDVEDYDCPYESVGCVAEDLCVQCKMDKVQDGY